MSADMDEKWQIEKRKKNNDFADKKTNHLPYTIVVLTFIRNFDEEIDW